MAMLDLKAAFDTIDHTTLFRCLNKIFSVPGSALAWFESYMQHRNSRVSIDGTISHEIELGCGTSQGSIIGPVQFITSNHLEKLFTNTIYFFIFNMLMIMTQIYCAYDLKKQGDNNFSVQHLQNCIHEINNWMKLDKLKLNMDKTEFILLGSVHNIKLHS